MAAIRHFPRLFITLKPFLSYTLPESSNVSSHPGGYKNPSGMQANAHCLRFCVEAISALIRLYVYRVMKKCNERDYSILLFHYLYVSSKRPPEDIKSAPKADKKDKRAR